MHCRREYLARRSSYEYSYQHCTFDERSWPLPSHGLRFAEYETNRQAFVPQCLVISILISSFVSRTIPIYESPVFLFYFISNKIPVSGQLICWFFVHTQHTRNLQYIEISPTSFYSNLFNSSWYYMKKLCTESVSLHLTFWPKMSFLD